MGSSEISIIGLVVGSWVEVEAQWLTNIMLGPKETHGKEDQVGLPELYGIRYFFKIRVDLEGINS